ncbi:hypothetical protein [Flavobacterium sp. 2]
MYLESYTIYKSRKSEFLIVYKELFPAIRFNLLLFKEKSKRISASIGAMGAVFRRNPEEEERIPVKMEPEKGRLCVFATLRD